VAAGLTDTTAFTAEAGSSTEKGVRALPLVFLLLPSLAACGGSAPVAEAPKTREPSVAKVKPEARAEQEPAPRRSSVECDDGSCFSCGDAVCLSGFYCSIGRSGRGCAWLPSCPGKPTCGCIGAVLRDEPSCSCQEKEGGVYVTCDGAKL
jgi:hypothetical protein